MTLVELSDEYLRRRDTRVELEKQLKQVREKETEAHDALMQTMLDMDIQNYTRGNRTVYRQTRVFWRVGDRDAFETWRDRTGYDMNLFYQIGSNKLRAFCREAMENGTAIPDGLEEAEKTTLGVRTKKGV